MDGEVHPCLNSYINLNTVIWFCKKIGSRPPTNEIIEKYQSGLRKTDNGNKNTYFRTRKIVIEVIIFNNEVKFIRKKRKEITPKWKQVWLFVCSFSILRKGNG